MNFRRRWMVQAITEQGTPRERSVMAESEKDAHEKGRRLFPSALVVMVYPQHSNLHGMLGQMSIRESNMKGRDS